MRKLKNSNRFKSNKGFTLVEVLVAIAVLAIILVPLLSAFVVSANTNAKARQTLRATTLAQNVMEELKAYSLEESANHYLNKDAANFVIGHAQASYETVQHVDGVHKALTLDEHNQVQGRVQGQYDFVLKGVSQESAKFDVEVQIRKPKVAGVGAYDLVNITSMNRSDCAYFAQEKSAHSIIGAEYVRRRQNYVNTSDISAAEFQDMMTRTITIDVNSAVDGSETVKVTFDYQIPTGYVTEDNRHYTEYTTIFDNYSSGEELKAVYLYYYPLYGVSTRDTFRINNESDLPVDIYLIKMKDVTFNAYDDTNYKPYVYVNETDSREDDTSNLKICTNIKADNLLSYYNNIGTTTDIHVTDLGNAEKIQNLYDVTIKVYKHDASAFDTSTGETTITFKEDKRISTFTGTVLDKAD